MKDEKMYLSTDPEVAKLVKVDMWQSRLGHVYFQESVARYDGCTHIQCEKHPEEPPYQRGYSCNSCNMEKSLETYNSFERVEWDQKTPISIYESEVFFYDKQSIVDYLNYNDMTLSELRLVLCEPKYAEEVDYHEIYEEILPDDCDAPDVIHNAFYELNRIIRECKEPLGWWQTDKAVIVTRKMLNI